MKSKIKMRYGATSTKGTSYMYITCKHCPKKILDMFLFLDYNGIARSDSIQVQRNIEKWEFVVSDKFESFLTSDAFKLKCHDACKKEGYGDCVIEIDKRRLSTDSLLSES